MKSPGCAGGRVGGDAVNSEVLLTAPMSPKGWHWTQGGLSSGGVRDD